MLGYNASVPSYVRQALFARSFDNDDLLPNIRKPVLITHGVDDAVVRPAVIEQQLARIGHAQVRMMAHAEQHASGTRRQPTTSACRSLSMRYSIIGIKKARSL